MRHGRKVNKLGRKSAHRKAMLANMASSLILHKRINTTLSKGKALRVYIEPLLTKSKDDSTHSRRIVFSYLQNKDAVTELFREISVKIADRPGGYTRVLKTGTRLGDNAEMCMVELVDYNENLLGTKDAAKGKATRRRRAGARNKPEDTVSKAVDKVAPAVKEPEVEADDIIGEDEVIETPVDETETPEQEATEEKSEDAEDQEAEKK